MAVLGTVATIVAGCGPLTPERTFEPGVEHLSAGEVHFVADPPVATTPIHAAHASRFHWNRAEGTEAVNLARGEWQCSRVYAVLGRGEPALWHARRCLAINEQAGRGDWDIASAYEAMARASAVAGDPAAAAEWKAKAVAVLDGIADKDDRDIIDNDLATLP